MINSANIDRLAPDFLYDTGLLMLVVLDINGRVLKANSLLENCSNLKSKIFFAEALKLESIHVFEQTLDDIISSPKKNHLVTLQFEDDSSLKGGVGSWEFSLVTDANMDITGIVGLGVSLNSTNTNVEVRGILDLLSFGRITLSSSFEILDGDDKSLEILGLNLGNYRGRKLFDVCPNQEFESNLHGKYLNSVFFRTSIKVRNAAVEIIVMKDQGKYHLFLQNNGSIDQDFSQVLEPFGRAQINAIPGAVWIISSEGKVVQQNEEALQFAVDHLNTEFFKGQKLDFEGFSLEQKLKQFHTGLTSNFTLELAISGNNFKSFGVSFGELKDPNFKDAFIMVQVKESSASILLDKLKVENKRLKDLAIRPSHILRSPLSSMLGLLDLIDHEQLDLENKKYFSYLKPLATELDDVIRTNAKKMSSLD